MFSYLLRIPRTRGFGIQSPTDYHFLRHVIRQRLPYYGYERLEDKTALLSRREVKILRFYFRLANYLQDRGTLYIVGRENFGGITPELRRLFITAGSRKVDAKQTSRIPSLGADTSCTLVLEQPSAHIKTIQQSEGGRVVFDMGDIAVIFCDPKRYTTIYKVNL